MFERDCRGHLARHGIDLRGFSDLAVLPHFERGPQTAAAHPGANVKPLYYQAKGRKKAVTAVDEDELVEDLN